MLNLGNQRDKIQKRVFQDIANVESQQKDIKPYKIFPESYNLEIKRVLRTEENQKTAEEEKNEMENSRRRYILQEQRVTFKLNVKLIIILEFILFKLCLPFVRIFVFLYLYKR